MSALLKVTAEALAGLDRRRTSDGWQKRAFEVARTTGPSHELVSRMQAYLEDRLASATERDALAIRLQVFRNSGIPESELDVAREQFPRRELMSDERARDLGYESAAAFRQYVREEAPQPLAGFDRD